jgi:hypothetical protein
VLGASAPQAPATNIDVVPIAPLLAPVLTGTVD